MAADILVSSNVISRCWCGEIAITIFFFLRRSKPLIVIRMKGLSPAISFIRCWIWQISALTKRPNAIVLLPLNLGSKTIRCRQPFQDLNHRYAGLVICLAMDRIRIVNLYDWFPKTHTHSFSFYNQVVIGIDQSYHAAYFA